MLIRMFRVGVRYESMPAVHEQKLGCFCRPDWKSCSISRAQSVVLNDVQFEMCAQVGKGKEETKIDQHVN